MRVFLPLVAFAEDLRELTRAPEEGMALSAGYRTLRRTPTAASERELRLITAVAANEHARGRWVLAVPLLRSAALVDRGSAIDSVEANLTLATYLLGIDRYAEAQSVMDQLDVNAPGAGLAWRLNRTRGLVAAHLGDFDRAADLLLRSAESLSAEAQSPGEHVTALMLMAGVAVLAAEPRDALCHLDQAAERAADLEGGLAGVAMLLIGTLRAYAYIVLCRYPEAVHSLEPAIRSLRRSDAADAVRALAGMALGYAKAHLPSTEEPLQLLAAALHEVSKNFEGQSEVWRASNLLYCTALSQCGVFDTLNHQLSSMEPQLPLADCPLSPIDWRPHWRRMTGLLSMGERSITDNAGYQTLAMAQDIHRAALHVAPGSLLTLDCAMGLSGLFLMHGRHEAALEVVDSVLASPSLERYAHGPEALEIGAACAECYASLLIIRDPVSEDYRRRLDEVLARFDPMFEQVRADNAYPPTVATGLAWRQAKVVALLALGHRDSARSRAHELVDSASKELGPANPSTISLRRFFGSWFAYQSPEPA